MRWHIIRTLWHKELLRHGANRGGILLVVLLMAASVLLSFFGGPGQQGGNLIAGVQRCCIDYWQEDDFVAHLKNNQPDELRPFLSFRHVGEAGTLSGNVVVYPQNTGAIQIRNADPDRIPLIWFWEPNGRGTGLAPFEIWFWKEARHFSNRQAAAHLTGNGVFDLLEFEEKRSTLKGALETRAGIATSLVLFGLFFVCVYLMPSMSCEERERGTLLAQALSPASAREILAARFLFYPVLAVLLAAVLAGVYRPTALAQPFFWLAVAAAVAGSMGIGLTIASLARTQRTASMAALGYMFVITLFLVICQQTDIPGLSHLVLEYHTPRMIHAALTDAVLWHHWLSLAASLLLAAVWISFAAWLFRRRGWQT